MTTFTVKIETRPGRWSEVFNSINKAKADAQARRLRRLNQSVRVVKSKRQAVAA